MKAPRPSVFAALSVLLIVLVFLFFKGITPERIAEPTAAPGPSGESGAIAPPATQKVTLFFLREEDGLFVPETRDIPSTGSVARDSEALLTELIKGSAAGLVSAVPPEAKLRKVFVTKDGTAYVDFTRDLADAHPSGSNAETATVYAVVDSLAFNFKSIKQVFILIDGQERETLNGHITLDRPFVPDFRLIAKT